MGKERAGMELRKRRKSVCVPDVALDPAVSASVVLEAVAAAATDSERAFMISSMRTIHDAARWQFWRWEDLNNHLVVNRILLAT